MSLCIINRSAGLSVWGLLGAAALLASGCHTPPSLPPVDVSGPGWNVQQGQALWRAKTGAAEIAGELFVASHSDGRSLVQFSKSPIPLIVARTDSNYWQVKFVPRDKSYGGSLPPPGRLVWPVLSNFLNGSGVADPWQFTRLPGQRWRLENPETGERLEGYVEPGLPETYLSARGDTLESIARKQGVTVDALRAANTALELDADGKLKPGQTIQIPNPPAP